MQNLSGEVVVNKRMDAKDSIDSYSGEGLVEWRAAVLLASPNNTLAASNRIAELFKGQFDFQRLRYLLVHHRIVLAAFANLCPELEALVPPDFAKWLRSRHSNLRKKVLHQFQIQNQIGAAFTSAGVQHRFFKGLTLSRLLHSDIAMRQAKDIDVMIHPSSLPVADACLRKLGYTSFLESDQPPQVGNRLAISRGKDIVYHAEGLPEVELHWRVDTACTNFSVYFTLALFDLPSGKPTPEEFVYLCWHAGKTLHHRFKWLLDIDCYLRLGEQDSSVFGDKALSIATEQGVERYVQLALYLLQRTFPWHSHRKFVDVAPYALQQIGQRIERRWCVDEPEIKEKLMMMRDRFYLPAFWGDRFAIATALLLLPTDDVREMLNRRSGLSAGFAKLLVPLLTISGYWRR